MSDSPRIMADVDEDEWIVVPTNWWLTPYTDVLWTYAQPESTKPKYTRAPHRPESLTRKATKRSATFSGSGFHGREEAHELELNESLVGVRGALDVLSVYEGHVGIEEVSVDRPKVDLSRTVEEDEVKVHQLRWKELMKDFVVELPEQTSDQSSDSEASNSPLFSGLESSHSSISSFGLSEWEHPSSMPSTPKPKDIRSTLKDNWLLSRASRSCNLSPSGTSPSKRLNASASTFIPQLPRPESQPVPSLTFSSDSSPKTSASSPSPPLPDFTFPSLNVPSIPKVKIEKDDQGFYTGIEEDTSFRTRPPLLPAFLQEESQRRKSPSRTRAIVDKLRSASSQATLGPLDRFQFDGRTSGSESEADVETPSVEDGEGWISIDTSSGALDSSVAAKAQRKRDLFLALNKHQRSESSSTTSQEISRMSGTDDGWIDPPVKSQNKHHKRQSSSSRPGKKRGKSAVSSTKLGGSAPVFPTLNPTGPGSQQPKSYSNASSMVPRGPVHVPAQTVPFVYAPGYPLPPVAAPVPMPFAPLYPMNVVQYPQPHPPNHHQRTHSLAVPMVGYAPTASGKAPSFVPHSHVAPVNYSQPRPAMW
ncbi:hypothetical protein K435DRAFT_833970 [Dendrothele bispora CBS 962.96]|uniref:Uncharacterized protein n=1 Tax=Dendrothele bispora (strain CBS 962.96) TaxID=1314807 RepID=A0A4S8MTS0_DENBC|nr:hypothetical protein K435DRAFT_833970 [Dendrothele bispora CBS 962.96]